MIGRIVEASISKSALQHNIQHVRKIAPNKKIIAMVKANGYGHGLLTVAHTLSPFVHAFGVANIDEAIILREHGIHNTILLVEGCFSPEEQALVQLYGLSQVLHSMHQVRYLKEYGGKIYAPFAVWIKINTGMNRLGFSCQQITKVANRLLEMKYVHLIGFATHFSVADNVINYFTKAQQTKFNRCLPKKKYPCSLANSAGILAWPETHGDWVRPGLMLYGASPFEGKIGKDHGLIPVMTLRAKLIAMRKVCLGECIGYGRQWRCTEPTAKIGIVGIGYGDGYPWHAVNGTPVLINGKQAPLLGRVAMDMIAIDLKNIPDVCIGDTVTLWGDGLPVEYIAEKSETIPYELFCRLTARVTMLSVK